MKREDYQKVKEIFQSALDAAPGERARYLNEKCSDNIVIRREVERLLNSYDSGYLEQPAVGKMAELVVSDGLAAGQSVGHYKIIEKIGEGGMGEVFLAEDTRLKRKIALKILPAIIGHDKERLRRFEQEARAASTLNHPNILTIHEFGAEDDRVFIASEFVEGETLRERLGGAPLALSEILDIAAQIAAALNTAHESGIIHRDIKPENIMLRGDGLVKVLDFGLAKLVEMKNQPVDKERETLAQIKTSPGLVMGTVNYMSPEQARGKTVDARTDIFSFGVMIYEMLSGKLPFKGENEVDVIASILHKEPPPLSQSAPDIPPELVYLVSKALQKNREERYQTVREFLIDLKNLNRELDRKAITGKSGFRITGGTKRADTADDALNQKTTARQFSFSPKNISGAILSEFKLHPKGSALTLAIIGMAIITVAVGLFKLNGRSAESFQNMRLAKLTSTGNAVGGDSAISPDGKYVVYAVNETGWQSLWVKQIETAGAVQIVPPAEVEFRGLTFSPDGNYIYFTMGERNGTPSIYKIPVLGGNARKLAADADLPVSFSPDGEQMVFKRSSTLLMTAKSDGSEARALATAAEGNLWNFTAWSPDGLKIAATFYSKTGSSDHLVEVSVKDGTQTPIASSPWLSINGVVWLKDGSGLIVNGRDPETQLSQLWLVSYPDGETRRITNDLSNYQGLSLTADGKTVVSVQQNLKSSIWVASDTGDPNRAQRITAEVGKDDGWSGLAWTPDGRIVYTVKLKGTQDLWIVNGDGSNNHQLTFNAKSNFSPTVSPDGRYIVFVSSRGGNIDLWKTDLDGGNPVQMTDDAGTETFPTISPDGKWVVYGYSDTNNKATVWKINIDGGNPVQLTDAGSSRPVVSPDGKFIACLYSEAGNNSFSKIAVFPFDGGLPSKVLDLPLVVKSRTFRWTPDGQALVYIDSRDRIFNMWSQPLDGSPPKQLTDFKSDRIFRFDLSPNGKGFALARGDESSDVVLINNFR